MNSGTGTGDWPLEGFGAALLIPTLEVLFLACIKVKKDELTPFSEFRGKTNVKDLNIESGTMSLQSLSEILSFPRALISLELSLVLPEHEMSEEYGTPEDLHRAISQHRASLEFLKIDDIFHPLYINKSEFPQLKVAEGCLERPLGAA